MTSLGCRGLLQKKGTLEELQDVQGLCVDITSTRNCILHGGLCVEFTRIHTTNYTKKLHTLWLPDRSFMFAISGTVCGYGAMNPACWAQGSGDKMLLGLPSCYHHRRAMDEGFGIPMGFVSCARQGGLPRLKACHYPQEETPTQALDNHSQLPTTSGG